MAEDKVDTIEEAKGAARNSLVRHPNITPEHSKATATAALALSFAAIAEQMKRRNDIEARRFGINA